MTIFRCLETFLGDFCKTYEPKLFGMHIGSVLRFICRKPGYRLRNVAFTYFWGCESVRGGSKMRFFRSLETSEGHFIRTHMSQSCLGCTLEVFGLFWKQEM